MLIEKIKKQFPILKDRSLIYLDNAATTQKPQSVIDAMVNFYTRHNSNVHRGNYPLSEVASELYERARQSVGEFINSKPQEVVFTSGTTESLNLVAQMLSQNNIIKKDDEVLLTEIEHHANLLPWQKISSNLKLISTDAAEEIQANPKLIAVSMASNVIGYRAEIRQLRDQFPNAIIVVDAAQAIAHEQVDVAELDIDFLAFSAHKMYGPTGIGVLYGKQKWLERLNPAKVGGGIVTVVSRKTAQWQDPPEKFEAGTPAIAQAVGLQAAIEFIAEIGWEQVKTHEQQLLKHLVEKLSLIPDIQIYKSADEQIGVVSFNIGDYHAHDIAYMLGDKEFLDNGLQICTRAGHHCVQILHREVLDVPASVRVSLGIYNSRTEIDQLTHKLDQIVNYLAQR